MAVPCIAKDQDFHGWRLVALNRRFEFLERHGRNAKRVLALIIGQARIVNGAFTC